MAGLRLFRMLSVDLMLLGIVGCGHSGYAELGLVEVSGLVTLDGAPLPGAKISFEGEDLRKAIGVSDAAGRFRLMYDSRQPGVTPGLKTVRITTADFEFEGDGPPEGAPEAVERIPARYNSASELKADVSTARRTFNFDLQSKPPS